MSRQNCNPMLLPPLVVPSKEIVSGWDIDQLDPFYEFPKIFTLLVDPTKTSLLL
jgi:hypothetical protein